MYEEYLNNETTPKAVHKSELDFTVGDKTYEVWVVEELVEIIKGDIDFAFMRQVILGTRLGFD